MSKAGNQTTVPYSSLDAVDAKEWVDKRATSIIDSVNSGLVSLDPNRLVSGYKLKNMSMMSNTGLNNRTRGRHYGSAMASTQDLIVNA